MLNTMTIGNQIDTLEDWLKEEEEIEERQDQFEALSA
jgi:hypothetical protein